MQDETLGPTSLEASLEILLCSAAVGTARSALPFRLTARGKLRYIHITISQTFAVVLRDMMIDYDPAIYSIRKCVIERKFAKRCNQLRMVVAARW